MKYWLRVIGLIMVILSMVMIDSIGFRIVARRSEFFAFLPFFLLIVGAIMNLFPYKRN